MIKKVIHILSLLAIATTLAACSAEQQKKSNKKPDTEHEQQKESTKEAAGELTIDGPELPVTMEDALVYAKGEFGEGRGWRCASNVGQYPFLYRCG